eukprot:XP_022282237.1 proteoglycan 4-like [Canis lupus familiaris]
MGRMKGLYLTLGLLALTTCFSTSTTQERQNRLKNRLQMNPSAQASSSPQQILFLRKSGRIPTQLNPSAQQRLGGSRAYLNPAGPKRSPKIKSSQSSAVQQISRKPSNYLNFPVKTRSRTIKFDVNKRAQKLIKSNKLLMDTYTHLKLDKSKIPSYQKNMKPKTKLNLLSKPRIPSQPKSQSKISEQNQNKRKKEQRVIKRNHLSGTKNHQISQPKASQKSAHQKSHQLQNNINITAHKRSSNTKSHILKTKILPRKSKSLSRVNNQQNSDLTKLSATSTGKKYSQRQTRQQRLGPRKTSGKSKLLKYNRSKKVKQKTGPNKPDPTGPRHDQPGQPKPGQKNYKQNVNHLPNQMNSTAPLKINKPKSQQGKMVKKSPRKPKPHFITKVEQNPKKSNSPVVLVGKRNGQHQPKPQAIGSHKIYTLSKLHNNAIKKQRISPTKTSEQKKINQRKYHLNSTKESGNSKPVANRSKRTKKVKKQSGQQRPVCRHCPSGQSRPLQIFPMQQNSYQLSNHRNSSALKKPRIIKYQPGKTTKKLSRKPKPSCGTKFQQKPKVPKRPSISNGPRKGHGQTKPQPLSIKKIFSQAKLHKNPTIRQQKSQVKTCPNIPKHHQTGPLGHYLSKPIRKQSGQRKPEAKATKQKKSRKAKNPPYYSRPPHPVPQFHLPGQPIPRPKVPYPNPLYIHLYKPIQHPASHIHCGKQLGKKHQLHPHRTCQKPALKPKPGFQQHHPGILPTTQPGKLTTNLNPKTSKPVSSGPFLVTTKASAAISSGSTSRKPTTNSLASTTKSSSTSNPTTTAAKSTVSTKPVVNTPKSSTTAKSAVPTNKSSTATTAAPYITSTDASNTPVSTKEIISDIPKTPLLTTTSDSSTPDDTATPDTATPTIMTTSTDITDDDTSTLTPSTFYETIPDGDDGTTKNNTDEPTSDDFTESQTQTESSFTAPLPSSTIYMD